MIDLIQLVDQQHAGPFRKERLQKLTGDEEVERSDLPGQFLPIGGISSRGKFEVEALQRLIELADCMIRCDAFETL